MEPRLFPIVVWMYYISAYIGILPLYFGWDKYRAAIGINDKEIILKLLFYSGTSIILISVFYIINKELINSLFLKYKRLTINNKVIPLTKSKEKLILILFFICSLIFIVYLSSIPEIPLFAQIKGSTSWDIKRYRSLATTDFGGKLYIYTIFFKTLYLFICFALFSNYLVKRNRRSLILFTLVFLANVFSAIYATQKAPFVWLLIGLILVYLISLNKKIKVNHVLFFGTTAVLVLFFSYKYFMNLQDRSAAEIFTSILSRAFTGQISPAYYYLELFPNQIGFLHGQSLPNPGGIFPWEHYRLTVEVMNIKFQNLASLDIVGSAPTAFWGESYANFGFLGIIIGSIYIGLILAITQIVFSITSKDPVNIAIYVLLILEFKDISTTGISNFIFNIDIIVILTLFLIHNKVRIRKNLGEQHLK